MNFKNLYGEISEENDLAGQMHSRYPVLPSSRRMDDTEVSQYAFGVGAQVKEDSSRVTPHNAEASAPSLGLETPDSPSPIHDKPHLQLQQQQHDRLRRTDTDAIIAQLVSENSRLNDEVQRLLELVQASYDQGEAKSENHREAQSPTH